MHVSVVINVRHEQLCSNLRVHYYTETFGCKDYWSTCKWSMHKAKSMYTVSACIEMCSVHDAEQINLGAL